MRRPSRRSLQLSKSKGAFQSDGSGASLIVSHSNAADRSSRDLKTPMRRLFFKLEMLRPSRSVLGRKRARIEDHNNRISHEDEPTPEPTADTPPPSSDAASSASDPEPPLYSYPVRHFREPAQHYTTPVPCMALQNSDHSIDAVVISTLLKLPFCCHDDLLSMPESRVIEVAQEMNERLPRALRMDLSKPYNTNRIRREVEWLVGIVKKANEMPVPGAPSKRAKSKGERISDSLLDRGQLLDDLDDLGALSPPTSPLAFMTANKHSRRRVAAADITMIMSPTKLTVLKEEDENEGGRETASPLGKPVLDVRYAENDADEDIFRTAKKRKFSSSSDESVEMITSTIRHIKAPLMLRKLYDDMITSPTPHRVSSHTRKSVIVDDISTNTAIKEEKVVVKTTVIDRSLIHTRPRYRSSSKFTQIQNAPQIVGRRHGPLQTSTPKKARRLRENRSMPTDGTLSNGGSGNRHRSVAEDTGGSLFEWSLSASKMPGFYGMQ